MTQEQPLNTSFEVLLDARNNVLKEDRRSRNIVFGFFIVNVIGLVSQVANIARKYEETSSLYESFIARPSAAFLVVHGLGAAITGKYVKDKHQSIQLQEASVSTFTEEFAQGELPDTKLPELPYGTIEIIEDQPN